MAFDLKIEIFANKWFHRILVGTELLSCKYDVTEVYKEECLAYPDCTEASDCDHLYYAIMFHQWLFEKLYLKEIKTHINEFRHSQTDFYCFVLRTCNRVDLFGNLKIFDRVFATCAFVCCLCLYCCENGLSEIMRHGHIYWAMYFDQFAEEFYKQGGWNRLKLVAVSYKMPMNFVHIVRMEERADVTLMKIRKAIKSYRRFKNNGKIDHDECISKSWVKFNKQYIDRSSENDFIEFFNEIHFNLILNYTEVENILTQLKYLCDPNGSEIVKFLNRISATDFLETSMTNLNICNTYVDIESKEETILTPEFEENTTSLNMTSKSSKKQNVMEKNSLTCREYVKVVPAGLTISSKRNSLIKNGSVLKDNRTKSEYSQIKSQEQGMEITATVEHLFENMTISKGKGEDAKKNTILTSDSKEILKKNKSKICYDSKEEQYEWNIIKKSNENTILNGQMPSTDDNAEKKNKVPNGISNEKDERKVKGTKRNMRLSEKITHIRKNTEKISADEAQNDVRKAQNKRKIEITTEEENTEMKNSNDIRVGNGRDECEIIKMKKKSKTTQKRRVRKANTNRNKDDIRNEPNELKDKKDEKNNTIPNSTGKNAEEENKDGDIKNFLRMLLVLGDKQGMSYVKKTS